MEKKYVVKGRVNGKQAVLFIHLAASHVARPSRYTLVARARGSFGTKETPMMRFLLQGRWWQWREEKGIWRVKNNLLIRLEELNGHLPYGEYEATAKFEALVGGRYILQANVQGTYLGDIIPMRIPF